MKKKYFLRGLGIGIIITALLLCIVYRKQMTDSNIIHKAKQLGMVFPERTSELVTEAAVTVTAPPDATLVPTEAPTEVPTAAPTAAPQATPTETLVPQPTATPKAVEKTEKREYVTITVSSGMDSSSVSKKLQSAGIVKSASKLDSYLVKNGYADRIAVGKYKIAKGEEFSRIAKILTK